MATNPPLMGISLGTTNSCVGVWRNGHVTIITNDRGKKTTPSCVAFTYLQRLIGEAANEQTHSDPKNTVFHAKRLIGKRFSDESVQLNMKQWPFEVIGFHDDKPRIVVKYRGEEKHIAAEEISAMVLIKLREMAEAYIKCTVKDAVITVPACFNSTQRQATKDAATIAGLNVLRIINEPTAVAIAYSNQKKPIGEKNIVIFNLGGGTCEVSVVNFQGGKFQVKASAGYTDLGGADFDKNMMSYFVEEIKRVRNKDISKDPMALGRLLKACEKAKKILSSCDYANIDINVNLVDGYFEYYSRISRQEFEEINMALFYKCMKVLQNCVSDSGLHKSRIHKVVLVGGSMKIPKVKKFLKDFFGEERLYYDMDKKEAAAFGATAHAPFSANNCMSGMLSFDVTPLPVYYENSVRGMEILFEKNTTLPASSVISINSERQGSGVFYRLYQRGTKILISNERIETTTFEFLGKFELSDLTNVLIEIDTSGILKISDEKITDGKKEKAIPKLSNHEIANMIKEAHKYKDDDKKVKAKIALENYCYKMSEIASKWKIMRSSLLKVFGKGIVLDAVKSAIQWSESNPLAEAQEYEKKMKKLETICKRYGCY